MIPLTFSSSEAQRLLDLGRAWLHGPEQLATRSAVYDWDAATQCYRRHTGATGQPDGARPASGTGRAILARLALVVQGVSALWLLAQGLLTAYVLLRSVHPQDVLSVFLMLMFMGWGAHWFGLLLGSSLVRFATKPGGWFADWLWGTA